MCILQPPPYPPGLAGWYPNGTLIGSYTVPNITGPQPIVQDQNGNLWIGDALSTNLVMFNMLTKSFTTRLTVSSAAKSLAFNPVNLGLYTGYGSGNIIARLNTNTGAAITTITLVVNPLPASPSPSSIIPAGLVIDYTNTVYVSDTSHTTSVYCSIKHS